MKCTWLTRKLYVGDPMQPIFHWLALGFCVGGNTNLCFVLEVTLILAFLDTNMLIYPRHNFAFGV